MRLIKRLFARYGRPATVDGAPVHIVFKTTGRSEQESFTPLGSVPRGQYTCLIAEQVRENQILQADGEDFLILRAMPMTVGKRCIYWRAVCRRNGGEDTWGI